MAATKDLKEDKQGSKGSRLLDLPPEIWSSIGRHVIDCAARVNLSEIYTSFVENTFLPGLQQPAITRVCGALRQELLPYYYRTCVEFQIWSDFASPMGHRLDPRLDWLVTIGRSNRKNIRGVSLVARPGEVDLARWRYRDYLGLEFDVKTQKCGHSDGPALTRLEPASEEQVVYDVRFL
ncbi:hypothetical protein D0869_03483 [Hortaea werneckii]|uniref:F-box domain-containing protein n=1 Tax=Hortaea werneckii TaxID=91943 RepID=A0A3M6Z4K4_HORWE|nr:hypothetical protein D0869_03483 [Hortaea werneckii]RMY10228.1 hypothetical protein D0868_03822 [Hortaea werneckii]